jgi:hypothetical protein
MTEQDPVCDFSRSYYIWQVNLESRPLVTVSERQPFTLNYVRVPLECRCHLRFPGEDRDTQYVLGAACKTERVNVKRDVWMMPNADYQPVASETEYLRIKSWDRCDKGVLLDPPARGPQLERQVGRAEDAYDFQRVDLRAGNARELRSTGEIIETALGGDPLTSRTEYETDEGVRVRIEYPVKAINVSEKDGYYHVDTGPVLFYDASIGHERPIGNLRLAYVAHNAPDWAEFIVNVPTPLNDEISVNHYARPVRVDGTMNRMFRMAEG